MWSLTRKGMVRKLFVVGAVSTIFFRIWRSHHIKNRTWRNSCELVDIASGCWIQHRSVARSSEDTVSFQPCQSHCKIITFCSSTSRIQLVNFYTEESKRHSRWEGGTGSFALRGSTQSYDFMCIFPNRSLLQTVISGWLWRGMTAVAGRKKIHNCKNANQQENKSI